jgi:hypothetical protein
MKPSIGRIVHYTLTEQDADQINRRRKDANAHMREHTDAATGVHVHVGNGVQAGDVYPLVITRVWASAEQVTEHTAVNGQVLLDGNDTLWVTSVSQGTDQRQWFAPPRV